jgi:hypothetical protein
LDKIDPYTGEIIEWHMDMDYHEGLLHIAEYGTGYYGHQPTLVADFDLDRLADDGCPHGGDMGPDTDARAGQFAAEHQPDEYEAAHYLTVSEILHNEEEHRKRVSQRAAANRIKYPGMDARVAELLEEYLSEVGAKLNGELAAFLKAKAAAVEDAYRMCENAELPMWNHIPGSYVPARVYWSRFKAQKRAAQKRADKQRSREPDVKSFASYVEPQRLPEPSPETTQMIAEAINKAMRHAERVCRRDHIKADRIERVNQFVVSLRRELRELREIRHQPSAVILTAAADDLTNKELWYDIGVLTLNVGSIYGLKHPARTIQGWVEDANRMKTGTDAARYIIEGDLEELERGLTGVVACIEDARKINLEGDQVVSQLCELFQ